jgi:lysyl-tRNA synthetase class 2
MILNGRYFLSDAMARVELRGEQRLFVGSAHGDLIQAKIVGGSEKVLECEQVEVVDRGRREAAAPARNHAPVFTRFTRKIRLFLGKQGLVEVFTPTLVRCPGLEPTLEPFPVEIQKGRDTRTVYLPTSPEIHLKKILSEGWTDIFEIKTCFRKGEYSSHHQPEFLMLEWYRGFAGLDMIIEDLHALLTDLAANGFCEEAPVFTGTTWSELFLEFLQFPLTPTTKSEELRSLCIRVGVKCEDDDSYNDLFHRLVIDRIEPNLKAKGALIVRDFPPSQAALARMTTDGWADRFEFFWNGIEIANAFNEVTDPDEQAHRWKMEKDERTHLGTSELPQDRGLIEAFEVGVPPTAGIALGLERLYMACKGVDDIRRLRFFAGEELFEQD